jgi:hypothetical protein
VRWERLFEELEARGEDLELEERDVLVGELRDGDWAQTSWRDLLGGRVSLDVQGAGRVEGIVALINERLVHLRGDAVDHVVAVRAVTTVHATERRADEPTAVGAALGWGHVLRALRDAGDEVRVRLVDGGSREGTVDVVGRDFVRLRSVSGRDQVVPFGRVAVVSGRT